MRRLWPLLKARLRPAPIDTTVTFTSSNSIRALLSDSVITIPAGQMTGSVGITTYPGALTTVTIKAKANGVTRSAVLTINP